MKKKSTKKVAALLMATTLFVCGCGNQNAESVSNESQVKTETKQSDASTPETQSSTVEEKVTLTVGIAANDKVEDFETNYLTGLLEEAANVDLEFVMLPATETSQKVTMMMTSGEELPDIFVGALFSDADLVAYGEQGLVIPLTEYYNDPTAMPNFHENVLEEDKKLMIEYVSSVNGELYSGPTYSPEMGNEYPYRAYINTEWLKVLDLEMPTTTEEFYNVLKAFKEKDPNGNGKADEIPMVGANSGWNMSPIQFLMNAFEYTDAAKNYMYVKDGEIVSAFTSDDWKEGLTYINKLVTEDLLSPLSFTQDSASLTAMVRNEDVAIVGCYTAGASQHTAGAGAGCYEPLPPLTGYNGACWATYNKALPSGRLVITKDCENVDAAIRVLDACYDRMITQVSRFGEPEVDWSTNIGNAVSPYVKGGLDTVTGFVEVNSIWGTTQNKHWNAVNPFYRSALDEWSIHARGIDFETVDTNSSAVVTPLAVPSYMDKHPEELIYKWVHENAEDEKEFADLGTAIITYVKESITRFIVGELPLDDWDEYIDTLSDIDLERYLELAQKAYDKY